MQLSTPWMRAIPSPISSTVPTSVRSAEPVSMPSIRSRRMLAISSGLISIAASFLSYAARATLFLSFSSLFLMLVSKTMFPTCTTSPPRMSGSTLLSQLDLVAGLLLDLRADPLGDLRIELDGAGHGDAEALVLLGPERVELAADPEEHRHPVLLQQQVEEVDQLRLGAGDRLREAVLLLGGREVGAEEEELHLAVLRECIGELAELLADRVELALLLGHPEEGLRIYAGDLLHR